MSKKRWLSTPVRLYTYVFRGTPLYVQLLLIYTGMYSLEFVRSHQLLDAFFRSGFHCAILAFALNTCAYTTEIFAGAIRLDLAWRSGSGPRLWHEAGSRCTAAL